MWPYLYFNLIMWLKSSKNEEDMSHTILQQKSRRVVSYSMTERGRSLRESGLGCREGIRWEGLEDEEQCQDSRKEHQSRLMSWKRHFVYENHPGNQLVPIFHIKDYRDI